MPHSNSGISLRKIAGAWHGTSFELAEGVRKRVPGALIEAACRFILGDGVLHNTKRADSLLRTAIRRGNPTAKLLHGLLVLDSPADFGYAPQLRAVAEIHDSAASGYAPAQIQFFRLVFGSTHLRRHRIEAIAFLKQAASVGNVDALYEMGVLLARGSEIRKNLRHSLEYFERAAEMGEPDAAFNAGIMYSTGECGRRNYRRAREMFELAATHDHPHAIYELGLVWESPKLLRRSGVVCGDDICPIRAAEHYGRSAAIGYARAQANFAVCCVNGDGVPRNVRTAVEMYSMAAIQNEALGCLGLAICLQDGVGVPVDVRAAAEWRKLATKLELQEAT